MKRKAEIAGWARRYRTALRRYLKQGASAGLLSAERLGRQAVTLGLETLDLAKVHEQALIPLVAADSSPAERQCVAERAKGFFDEAIVPIERTHRSALKADVRATQLTETLNRRTAESSASTQHLAQSITERQLAEASLKKSGKNRVKLMQESSRLQNSIQSQTRSILTAQEDERHKTSLHLQDEIAQTLLAINIRLLTLKTSAKASTEKFEDEIATTQRLVRKSIKRINRFAHEFDTQHKN